MPNSFATLWTVAHQAPLSMGFPRQEYWSCLPLPSPGHLPNPGIKPASPELAGRFFNAEPPGKPLLPLRYLVTACLLLCIFHWMVGSKRAEPSSLVQMVSPAPVSKLGMYWMVNHTFRIFWTEWKKHNNHSWKSFKELSLLSLLHPSPLYMYTKWQTPLPIDTRICILALWPTSNQFVLGSHQSILKEINPEYSLEGLMLKLKLQYFGNWCEELTH